MKERREDNAGLKGHCGKMLTPRISLRQITEGDTRIIVKLRSEPMHYRFFRSPHQLTPKEHLCWFQEKYLPDPNRVDWIALLDKKPIGLFGLCRVQDVTDYVEVSYLLDSSAQGQGYASEAVEALLQWAIREWHSKTAFAEIHCENKASTRFAIRMGFQFWKQELPFVFYRREL